MMINKKVIKFNITNIITFFEIIIYRLLLDFAYFDDICITYSSYGFKDYRSIENGILSWLIIVIFIFPIIKLIDNEKNSFSNIIIYILSLISIIPFTTLVYSGILSTSFIIMYIIYWIVLFISYAVLFTKDTKPLIIKFNKIHIDEKFSFIFACLSISVVLFISWKYTGFRMNFNMFNVYELRSEYINYNFPRIVEYLFAWTRAINIVFIGYSIVKKRYFIAAAFFLAQMLSFGIDGLKSTFFMAILVLIFCLLYKNEKKYNFKKICLHGILGLSLLGAIEKVALKTNNIITLLIRRVLMLPIYLNSCYVDFFQKNPPDYFKSSFLRLFGATTSYYKLDHIIGKIYFNRPQMGCNNGLIAEAVTNFGTIGILIMPILLVLVLKFMDKCVKGVEERVFLVIALYFAITISNTFLTTALLTHGLLISTILMLILKSKDKGEKNVKDKK